MLLVDHFMDKHIVMDYRLKLVALASLLVAGKLLTEYNTSLHAICCACSQV